MQYTERLLNGGSCLTRFSHRGRHQKVCEILSNQKYERVVDVGCADGWFLKMAWDRGLVTSGIGIDSDANMLGTCREKFRGIESFRFLRPSEVTSNLQGTCDLAICTETLEHVISQEEIIDQLLTFCKSGAKVVISAPIEVGPSLVAKQVARFFSQRGCESYGYEKYQFQELMQAGVFWDTSLIDCPHNNPESAEKGHKGFDYRKLDALIRKKTKVDSIEYSPMSFMGKILNSTVYWICQV